MRHMGTFYILKNDDDVITIQAKDFLNGGAPILWCNKGLYGLIPIDIVRDALDYFNTKGELNAIDFIETEYTIYWDQVMYEGSELGPALVPEEMLEEI